MRIIMSLKRLNEESKNILYDILYNVRNEYPRMQFMWSYHFGLGDYVLYYNGSHEFESDYDFEQKINNDFNLVEVANKFMVSNSRGALPTSGTPSWGGHLPERGAGLPGHQRFRLPALVLPSHGPAPPLPHQQVQSSAEGRSKFTAPLPPVGQRRLPPILALSLGAVRSVAPSPTFLHPPLIPGLLPSPPPYFTPSLRFSF